MNYDIDTGEIRRVAGEIRSISGAIRDLSATDLAAIRRNLEGNFEGEAATALAQALDTLSSDVAKISGGLNAIQRELLAYAARIDAADEAAAAAIRAR